MLESSIEFDKEAPSVVEPQSPLRDDMFVLESLMEGTVSLRAPVRLLKSGWIRYGIGDVSGNEYGDAVYIGEKLHYVYGQWTSVDSNQSSDYRELHNLVNTVQTLYEEGLLKNCKLFLYTDNSVADWTYYRGSSSSRLLFLFILRLQKFKWLII